MDLTDYHVNLVKQLKEDTGFGMMDCKKALIINDWNVDKAEKYLIDMEEASEKTRLINRTIED